MSGELNTESLVLWFDDLGTGNEEFRFLSNFYEGDPIILPGVDWQGNYNVGDDARACEFSRDSTFPEEYEFQLQGQPVEFPTGEHAFAAMKYWGTPEARHFFDIAQAEDPGTAKAYGQSRKRPIRQDWELVKYDVMAAILRVKFSAEREEGARLLATGDKMLVEGTYWHDRVWGVDMNARLPRGRNWLGTLLMARRAELRAVAVAAGTGADTAHPDLAKVAYFAGDTKYWNTNFARGSI